MLVVGQATNKGERIRHKRDLDVITIGHLAHRTQR